MGNSKLVCIIVLGLLSSCKTVPCVDSNTTLFFVSFPDAQTDSIVLRKYVKNSNFNTIVDSTIITKNNSYYENSNDTLHILTSNGGDYVLDIQSDYEVYLPFANKLFQISNFVEKQTEMKVGLSMDKTQCINPITSYTLNGQTISGQPDYHFIYLHK